MEGTSSTSEFTRRLREAIETSEQSLDSVAEAVGLGGRQALHPYLTGRVEPTLQRVEQLAKVLHVDRRWLAGWQPKGGPLGTRRPLADDEQWEQAITAFYRYAARQTLGALPPDPKERRSLLRKSDKAAKYAAYCGYRHMENPAGWEGDFPVRKLCYLVGNVIFLNAADREVARICMYLGKHESTRMRVMSARP